MLYALQDVLRAMAKGVVLETTAEVCDAAPDGTPSILVKELENVGRLVVGCHRVVWADSKGVADALPSSFPFGIQHFRVAKLGVEEQQFDGRRLDPVENVTVDPNLRKRPRGLDSWPG